MHFCSSIIGVYCFCHRVVRKATKILTPIYVNTWQRIGRHYKRNIPFTIFIHWLKLTSLLLSMILIQKWILFWIKRHLFLHWCIHHVFHLTIFWIWCMNFCNIVLSLMNLLVALIFVLKYACNLWSCSSISITHVCCNMTIGFRKTS